MNKRNTNTKSNSLTRHISKSIKTLHRINKHRSQRAAFLISDSKVRQMVNSKLRNGSNTICFALIRNILINMQASGHLQSFQLIN